MWFGAAGCKTELLPIGRFALRSGRRRQRADTAEDAVKVGGVEACGQRLSCRERQLGSVLTSTCNTFWPSPF